MNTQIAKFELGRLPQAVFVVVASVTAAIVAMGIFATVALQFEIPDGGGKGPDRDAGPFVCQFRSTTDYCAFDDMLFTGVGYTFSSVWAVFNLPFMPLEGIFPTEIAPDKRFEYIVFPTLYCMSLIVALLALLSTNEQLIRHQRKVLIGTSLLIFALTCLWIFAFYYLL